MKKKHHLFCYLLRRVVFVLGVILLLSACSRKEDWVMFRGEQGRGYTSNTVFPPLAVKWKLRLQIDNKPTLSFNPPVVLDGTIYFGSVDGNFYALDIESGYMRWVFKSEGAINSVPFADENNVYFGSNDGKVYALSREDGTELWSFDTGHTVQSTVARYGDWVVFTSDVGATYFLSVQGEEKFRIPNPVWLYHTFQMYEDVMYFAPGPVSNPVSFGAYDLNKRGYLWVVDASRDGATWYSFPALRDQYLFYSTGGLIDQGWEFVYYGLNRETGDVLWQYVDQSRLGSHIQTTPYRLFRQNLELLDYMAPSLWKDLVIFTSGDSVVRAFNVRSGKMVWKRVFDYVTSSAPTVASDRVYFGLSGETFAQEGQGAVVYTKNPRIVCLSARNGRFLWELDIEGAVLSAPVIAGKWIIFGTDRNFFYVLEEVY